MSPTVTAVLLDGARMQYHEVISFSSSDANAARQRADTDLSGLIDANETLAYEQGCVASMVGNATAALRWDGTPAVWAEATATTQKFDRPNFNAGYDLIVDGEVSLASSPGINHSLTLSIPAAYANFSFALSLPSNWSIAAVSGFTPTSLSPNSVSGHVPAGALAAIQVSQTPPPPSLPLEATTPPGADAGPDREAVAGIETTVAGLAYDDDPAFPQRSSFWWSFTYNGTPATFLGLSFSFAFWTLGPFELTFWVQDAWGTRASDTMQLSVLSPDNEAPSVYAGPDDAVTVGSTVAFIGSASDNDLAFPAAAAFWWSFEYNNYSQNLSGSNASFRFDIPGDYLVTFWARDGWGNVGRDTRTVSVDAAPAAPSSPGANANSPFSALGGADILAPMGLVALGVVSAAGIVAYRRRSSAAHVVSLSRPAGIPAGRRSAYVLEGLLILYRDGRLIHHASDGAESRHESPEVLGSMFTAVAAFIRDSFREAGALSRLTYGQNTILLERSPHFFAAAIAYGEPDHAFREQLTDTMRRLESSYIGVAEQWNGEPGAFMGMAQLVAPLFLPTKALTRANVRESMADKNVRLLSGTEHYKGYLRLKVAVANPTAQRIRDVSVTVKFNETVLHLARVEPVSFARKGATVSIGEIGPGERVGAVFYLDPQACNETDIDGRAAYRDAEGEWHHVAMKTRRAEIVCPIFFTPEHANGATLRRLTETALAANDAKLYDVAGASNRVPYRDLFLLAVAAVERYDVKLVRSVCTQAPFDGRAWFYGETKAQRKQMVIRVTVSEQRGALEFFAAADAAALVTGLLAELHHAFIETLFDKHPFVTLDPVLDESRKGVLTSNELVPVEPRRDAA